MHNAVGIWLLKPLTPSLCLKLYNPGYNTLTILTMMVINHENGWVNTYFEPQNSYKIIHSAILTSLSRVNLIPQLCLIRSVVVVVIVKNTTKWSGFRGGGGSGLWTLEIAYFVNDSTIVPTLRKTDLQSFLPLN